MSQGAPPELHLPDLPEVAVGLPAAAEAPARAVPWRASLAQAASGYLPLWLMLLLATFTWWLVRQTPAPQLPRPQVHTDLFPDYTMQAFSVSRFDAAGQPVLRLAGASLRHFPASDRMEIEAPQVQAQDAGGGQLRASALRAEGQADASRMTLRGQARLQAVTAQGIPLDIQGDHLEALMRLQRLSAEQPVQVRYGASRLSAAGLRYDHAAQTLELLGPVRAVMIPGGAAGRLAMPPAPQAKESP